MPLLHLTVAPAWARSGWRARRLTLALQQRVEPEATDLAARVDLGELARALEEINREPTVVLDARTPGSWQ